VLRPSSAPISQFNARRSRRRGAARASTTNAWGSHKGDRPPGTVECLAFFGFGQVRDLHQHAVVAVNQAQERREQPADAGVLA
jgi:hypothetical protein